MIQFISLASGSSGNCYYFTNGTTSFLIDAGVGPRNVKKVLLDHSLSIESVDFILVTHDHMDHIKALGLIVNKYHKPVYTTKNLRNALLHHKVTRNALKGNVKIINCNEKNDVCGLNIVPFIVPHDATETVGYYIEFDNKIITIVTDCGEITDDVLKYSKLADVLIFETNYDEEMLVESPYPDALKNRIKYSGHGHLSNNMAAEALKEIYFNKTGSLDYLFLCHLSGQNNKPEIALSTVKEALKSVGVKAEEVMIRALPRGRASVLYSI